MQKSNITFSIFLFCVTFSYAQADIDREYFPVSYVGIPKRPVLNENQRTYDIKVELPEQSSNIVSGVAIENLIRINGLLREEEGPQITTRINITNLFVDATKMKVLEKKHDSDEQPSKKYYEYTFPYNIVSDYSITTSLYEDTKGQINESREYLSTSFDTKDEAYDHYSKNIRLIKENIFHDYVNQVVYKMNNLLNTLYGYSAINKNDYLWILDSKNNPYTEAHKKAISEVFTRMKTMRHNKSIDEIRNAMIPVINTFDDIAESITGDKRKDRKVRYASYYNNAVLSYYLDDAVKSREYAEKALEQDYNKREATLIYDEAIALANLLKVNNLTSRHMEILQDDKFNAVEDENNNSMYSFLITKANDTLIANMNWDDLPLIGNEARVYLPDNNGNLKLNVLPASDILELVIDENNIYVQRKFISYKDNPRAKEASIYLVRKEFESDVISLYTFKEEEMVFLLPGEEEGHSTRSLNFIMGLKKELTKFSDGCEPVNELIEEGYYKNNPASLRTFVEDIVNCEDE